MPFQAKSLHRSLVLVVLLLAVSGCASTPKDVTDRSIHSIEYGTVADPGLRIVAKDGAFELRGGQDFDVPFDVNLWREGAPFSPGSVVANYREALDRGGREVLVYVPSSGEPLHGVLAFNKMIGAAHGPSSRSYRVTIPNERIVAAQQGNTTVTFEAVDYTRSWSNGASEQLWWYAWVLWLADTPL